MNETTATISVTIGAPPEIVFGHLVEPERMLRWVGRSVALDPVPGGTFAIEMDDDATASGTFVEVVPHERVVFTWGWVGDERIPPGSSTVEISLKPVDAGTELTLVHSGLPTADDGERHTEGWTHFLGQLVELHA